ncbi:MAG: hypothetical protein QME66_08270 [Candidatus Eisenbacteria bacterium]|nr:hypothetical protein [Candidatus Eisenbacteria bacterium]
MPSTIINQTTAFGSGRAGQPAATILLRAQPAANQPAVLDLQKVNDSGTVTNQYLWFDHLGRLRTHTSYPTDQDSDGRDITASLAAGSVNAVDIASNTITPGLLSASSREMYIPIPIPSLNAGTDVSNRVVYRNTSVTTLNRGSCFIVLNTRMSVTSGQNVTIGIGNAAAGDIFGRTFTATVTAGTLTSLTAGSATTLPVSTNLRLDVVTSASQAVPAGQILWFPQKRGSN